MIHTSIDFNDFVYLFDTYLAVRYFWHKKAKQDIFLKKKKCSSQNISRENVIIYKLNII